MDNLNTHKEASLYEAFSPEKARALIMAVNFAAGAVADYRAVFGRRKDYQISDLLPRWRRR